MQLCDICVVWPFQTKVATFDGLIGFVDEVEYVHDINIEMLEKKFNYLLKHFIYF
jgi:hypothetical protein